MKPPRPVCVDFETHGIKPRPAYPPVPVGVSIKHYGRPPRYYAWGHPTKNNCCLSDALTALREAWGHQDGLLFQNAKFDLDVAEVHLGLALPTWQRVHDTQLLLFLDDPHQRNLSLKPSAERLLGMKPEEQDAVASWLVEHQPVRGVKISRATSSEHYAGAYIAYAPGDIVGKYANGDVVRTERLFQLLWPKTVARGMLDAYDRERQLTLCLLDMERQGVAVDQVRLEHDVALYRQTMARLEVWLVKRLRCDPDVNFDSGEQLVAVCAAAEKLDLDRLPLTPTGKHQTNKEALAAAITDRELLGVLTYRTQLSTCLQTFMLPWLETAKASGGLIYTTWHQTRSENGGTRTGRLSSSPNFQNIPKTFEPIFRSGAKSPLPKAPWPDLPPLPLCRGYITPFKGDVLIDRDFSQQELRILAHFDGGKIMEQYRQDVWTDLHDYAREELAKAGKHYERKPVKNTNFGLIYGMGVGKLAEKNNMEVVEAKALKTDLLRLYPGLKSMYNEMRFRAKSDQPIRTWGGREYYCEPPRLVDGRVREFDYKLVNVLIQGSAADATKEALIRFYRTKSSAWKLILNVHDQLTVSTPKRELCDAMEALRTAMEGLEFDVPLLSEGSIGTKNWSELVDYDKKGKIVWVR